MANYAFLDSNNIVTEVISGIDEADLIEGQDPETWYANFRGQVCKRTSINTRGGVHLEGGTPFRKNYAGIGFFYDEEADAFMPPQDFPSWILNTESYLWEAPKPYPEDGSFYAWDEGALNWVEIVGE